MRYLLLFILLTPMILSVNVIALEKEAVTKEDGIKKSAQEADQFSSEDYINMFEEREKRLNIREEEIKKEEESLKMLKLGIEEDIKRYTALRNELQKDFMQLDKEREDRFNRLVKIYEMMSPSEAASRLIRMEEGTIIKLISKMKEKAAGKILGQMEPSKAAKISEKIVKERPALGR